MAAVVLLIGLSSSGGMSNTRSSDEDLHMIKSIKRIFQQEKRERGCNIASQCRRILMLLSGDNVANTQSLAEPDNILILYFDTVMQWRSKRKPAQTTSGTSSRDGNATAFSTSVNTNNPGTEEQKYLTDDQTIGCGGDYPTNSLLGGMHWKVDGFSNFPVDNLSTWLDTAVVILIRIGARFSTRIMFSRIFDLHMAATFNGYARRLYAMNYDTLPS
ncbi:hypothetical protein K432DRAFT_395228 [Lepidopterella palustris CBS 459.81]|uniref:Uncharacterized protein n=1 Tax=Lepidopterella palustris CBS 459.81 TaxID=1314670 RepID=A0A8E2E5T9_9PEZI|nr:hypothetical protein K432DRAFT_395228 [Lepidopterella palustris CBS 459.81]